jgi:hypothetical protein
MEKKCLKCIPHYVYACAMAELAYPPGIYQSIFYTALFLHPTHIYVGFACGMTSCALMGVALYATSLNYWRHPVMSSRTTNRSLTTLPLLTGSGLYVASFYLYQKKYVKSAAVCHCLLHVLVSIGASMIYKDYYDARAVTHANSLLQLCNNNHNYD